MNIKLLKFFFLIIFNNFFLVNCKNDSLDFKSEATPLRFAVFSDSKDPPRRDQDTIKAIFSSIHNSSKTKKYINPLNINNNMHRIKIKLLQLITKYKNKVTSMSSRKNVTMDGGSWKKNLARNKDKVDAKQFIFTETAKFIMKSVNFFIKQLRNSLTITSRKIKNRWTKFSEMSKKLNGKIFKIHSSLKSDQEPSSSLINYKSQQRLGYPINKYKTSTISRPDFGYKKQEEASGIQIVPSIDVSLNLGEKTNDNLEMTSKSNYESTTTVYDSEHHNVNENMIHLQSQSPYSSYPTKTSTSNLYGYGKGGSEAGAYEYMAKGHGYGGYGHSHYLDPFTVLASLAFLVFLAMLIQQMMANGGFVTTSNIAKISAKHISYPQNPTFNHSTFVPILENLNNLPNYFQNFNNKEMKYIKFKRSLPNDATFQKEWLKIKNEDPTVKIQQKFKSRHLK